MTSNIDKSLLTDPIKRREYDVSLNFGVNGQPNHQYGQPSSSSNIGGYSQQQRDPSGDFSPSIPGFSCSINSAGCPPVKPPLAQMENRQL